MAANTYGQPAMTAIIDVKGGKKQYDRKLHPINFAVDQTTNKLTTLMAWPGVYICKGSTLFTDALGYTDDDLDDLLVHIGQQATQRYALRSRDIKKNES